TAEAPPRSCTRSTGVPGGRGRVLRSSSPVDPPDRHAGLLCDADHASRAGAAGERDYQFGAGLQHLAAAEHPGRLAVLAPVGRVRLFLDKLAAEARRASPATREEVSTLGRTVDDHEPANVPLAQGVEHVEHTLLVPVVATTADNHAHRIEREASVK